MAIPAQILCCQFYATIVHRGYYNKTSPTARTSIVTPGSSITKQQIVELLQSNQPARAKELCLGLERTSADPQVHVLLAHAQIRLGETEGAVLSMRQALKRGWRDPNAFVLLVALLLHQDKQEDAESWFGKLIKQLSDEAEAHRQVANALRQLGDRSRAIERYHRAVRLGPQDFLANFELAVTLQEAQLFEEAAQWYEKSLAIRADKAQIYCNLALCFAGMKQIDRAAAVLEQAAGIAPSNPVVHFNLGETYQKQNRYPPAIASYRRALELSPDSAALYGSIARATRQMGDLGGAVENLRRAQALEPANPTVYHELGICLFDDRNLEPSRNAFMEAVRLNPGNALSRFYLGLVLARSGAKQEADQQFSQAVCLWPYLESFVDSYEYANTAGPDARYFCTTRQMYEHAVANADESGLYLEFGVYYGASINIIARLTDNTVHGFDTFQGLPIDWVVGYAERPDVEPAGSYSTHGTLPEAPDNVRYHVGTFEDTLPAFREAHPEPVSFMNIDCDLYESTVTIFRNLASRIRLGTVIVFDEYFCLSGWRDHEYKAFQEFLHDNELGYEYLAFNLFTGQVSVRIAPK